MESTTAVLEKFNWIEKVVTDMHNYRNVFIIKYELLNDYEQVNMKKKVFHKFNVC